MIALHEFSDQQTLASRLLRERASQSKVPISRQFVATENCIEVGYLSSDNHSKIAIGVLYDLHVLTEYRKRGIGTAIVSFAEEVARTAGCKSIRLTPKAFDASVDQAWLESWYLKNLYSVVNNTSEFEKVFE